MSCLSSWQRKTMLAPSLNIMTKEHKYLDTNLLQGHLTWTPVHINDTVFLWVLTSWSFVGSFGCFGWTCYLHLKLHGVITCKTTGDYFHICGNFNCFSIMFPLQVPSVMLCCTAFILLFGIAMYGVAFHDPARPYSPLEAGIFAGTYRFVWSLGISIIIVVIMHGKFCKYIVMRSCFPTNGRAKNIETASVWVAFNNISLKV